MPQTLWDNSMLHVRQSDGVNTMESPYPPNLKEKQIGVLHPIAPTPSIDGPVFTDMTELLNFGFNQSIAWVLWGVALIMVISRIIDTRKRCKKFGVEAWFSIGSFVALSFALAFAMVSFKKALAYVITFVIPGEKGQKQREPAHKFMQISSTLAAWKKIMAIVVFTLGVLIIIFAVLRIIVSLRAFDAQFPAVQASAQLLTWSQLQLAMSSIVANAPALRNLIQYQITKFREKRATKQKSKGKSSEGTDDTTTRAASNQGLGVRRKRNSFEKLEAGLVSVDENEQPRRFDFAQSSTTLNAVEYEIELEQMPPILPRPHSYPPD
ncbi:hypothetical protein KEM56_002311, partial [Ascosphaera pollenicola]